MVGSMHRTMRLRLCQRRRLSGFNARLIWPLTLRRNPLLPHPCLHLLCYRRVLLGRRRLSDCPLLRLCRLLSLQDRSLHSRVLEPAGSRTWPSSMPLDLTVHRRVRADRRASLLRARHARAARCGCGRHDRSCLR